MDPRALLDRFGRQPDPPPDLAAALGDLDRLALDRLELASPARSLSALLRAAFLVPDPGKIGTPDLPGLARGWSEGIPAFRVAPPRMDAPALNARARAVAEAVATGSPPARSLAEAIRKRRVDPAAWAEAVLDGRPEEVERQARGLGADPEAAASVLRLAMLPALAVASRAIDRLRPEGAWDRGDCPNCGSRPLLAESRGLEQRIALRCGLCAGDWPGERLGCPSCGESSPRALHHSFVEGEQDRYRLAHCDSCSYDWKVISTLGVMSPPALLVADLSTVHLDLLAADRRGSAAPPG